MGGLGFGRRGHDEFFRNIHLLLPSRMFSRNEKLFSLELWTARSRQ
jgi:hypothetical protein